MDRASHIHKNSHRYLYAMPPKMCPLIRPALITLVTSLMLPACSDKGAHAHAVPADQIMPADTRLADLYERSCKACHSQVGSVAPLTGDASAWAPRLSKGMSALQGSVRDGLNGMPAGGLCLDCTDTDIDQLIHFMATPAAEPKP